MGGLKKAMVSVILPGRAKIWGQKQWNPDILPVKEICKSDECMGFIVRRMDCGSPTDPSLLYALKGT